MPGFERSEEKTPGEEVTPGVTGGQEITLYIPPGKVRDQVSPEPWPDILRK